MTQRRDRREREPAGGRTTDRRGLFLLLATAAAVGAYLEATRDRGAPPTPSAAPADTARARNGAPESAPALADEGWAIAWLETHVRRGASDSKNPWALAHGVIAFGKDFRADDGRPAVEIIMGLARKRATAGGREIYGFPTGSAETPVEPHRSLMVKTLLESGIDLDHEFRAFGGETVTLRRLVVDVGRSAEVPRTDGDWRQAAWTLSALYDPHVAALVRGAPVDDFRAAALARLEQDDAPVVAADPEHPERAFDPGAPLRAAKEAKEAIYAHSCGGLHLVQAVISSVGRSGTTDERSRAAAQVALLQRRYEAERALYARMGQRRPRHRLLVLAQQLKLFGHLLETLDLAREEGIVPPGGALPRLSGAVAADLVRTVQRLEEDGAYGRLDRIRQDRRQTYLDLIGDGCHAIRALRRLLHAAGDSGS